MIYIIQCVTRGGGLEGVHWSVQVIDHLFFFLFEFQYFNIEIFVEDVPFHKNMKMAHKVEWVQKLIAYQR